jgi:hypothetical protein
VCKIQMINQLAVGHWTVTNSLFGPELGNISMKKKSPRYIMV